jgi:hypothetical protein
MNKHLDLLNDLYCWFYIKYNIEDINTEKLRRVANNTITFYLENNINLEMWRWGWECDRVKQEHEYQHHHLIQSRTHQREKQ